MNRSDPRVRRGAHRTRRDAAGTVLPSLLAVLAVTSLITALYVWRGEEARQPQAAAATTDAQIRADTSGPATPTAAPTPSPTQTPSTTPTRTADTATSTPATKTKTRTGTADTSTVAPDMTVVVLNQTRRTGLAGVVADRLRGRGWTVAGVGNFRGIVPATTVYYPAGAEARAWTAAGGLPTPPRVRPRFGNLSTTRLTVVVTDSYPG